MPAFPPSDLDLYFDFLDRKSKKGEKITTDHVPLPVLQPCVYCSLCGDNDKLQEIAHEMMDVALTYFGERDKGIYHNPSEIGVSGKWFLGLNPDSADYQELSPGSDAFAALNILYDFCTNHCSKRGAKCEEKAANMQGIEMMQTS